MRCDQIIELLPDLVDGPDRHADAEAHIAQCLRCQAEMARYRKLVRALALVRTRRFDPGSDALDDILAALAGVPHPTDDRARSGRRLAVAGAIGGTVATAATVAAILARSRRVAS